MISEKTGKILAAAVFLLGLLLATQLVITGVLSGKGDELARLEKRVAELERQNLTLSQEIAQRSSLSRISELSQELGFVKPEEFVYLSLTEPVAGLNRTGLPLP